MTAPRQAVKNRTCMYTCICGYTCHTDGHTRYCVKCGKPVDLIRLDRTYLRPPSEREQLAALKRWRGMALALHPDLYGLELK